jgi:hypothetical protein
LPKLRVILWVKSIAEVSWGLSRAIRRPMMTSLVAQLRSALARVNRVLGFAVASEPRSSTGIVRYGTLPKNGGGELAPYATSVWCRSGEADP